MMLCVSGQSGEAAVIFGRRSPVWSSLSSGAAFRIRIDRGSASFDYVEVRSIRQATLARYGLITKEGDAGG